MKAPLLALFAVLSVSAAAIFNGSFAVADESFGQSRDTFIRGVMNDAYFDNDRKSAENPQADLEDSLGRLSCVPNVRIESEKKEYFVFGDVTRYRLDATAMCPQKHEVEVKTGRSRWDGPVTHFAIYVDGQLR